MSFQLNWIDQEFYDYYVSGVITENFDVEAQNQKLISLVQQKKEVIAVFKDLDRMLILTGFQEYTEEENEDILGYLLDEEMIETIEAHSDEKNLSLMIGIIALQYFQFDTLEDIIMLDEADLESLTPEEREEIEGIQNVFKEMPEGDKERFLEQELFYYEEEELKQWMASH